MEKKSKFWMIEAYSVYSDHKVCYFGPFLKEPSDEDVNDAILAYTGGLPDGQDGDEWADEPVYSCVGEVPVYQDVKEWLKAEKLEKVLKTYKAERLQYEAEKDS